MRFQNTFILICISCTPTVSGVPYVAYTFYILTIYQSTIGRPSVIYQLIVGPYIGHLATYSTHDPTHLYQCNVTSVEIIIIIVLIPKIIIRLSQKNLKI